MQHDDLEDRVVKLHPLATVAKRVVRHHGEQQQRSCADREAEAEANDEQRDAAQRRAQSDQQAPQRGGLVAAAREGRRERRREDEADRTEQRQHVGGDAQRVEGQRGAMQRVRDAPPLGGDHADRQEDRDQVERGELAGDERRSSLEGALRHRLDDRLREEARVRSVLGAEGEPEAVALLPVDGRTEAEAAHEAQQARHLEALEPGKEGYGLGERERECEDEEPLPRRTVARVRRGEEERVGGLRDQEDADGREEEAEPAVLVELASHEDVEDDVGDRGAGGDDVV